METTREYECLECGHMTEHDDLNECPERCEKCGSVTMMAGPVVPDERTDEVKGHIVYLTQKGYEAVAVKEFIERDFGSVYFIAHAAFGSGTGGGWPLSVEMVGGERFTAEKHVSVEFKED